MASIGKSTWMMRALCGLLFAMLVYGQSLSVSHAHEDLDHAPEETCDVCLAVTSDDEDIASMTLQPSDNPTFMIELRFMGLILIQTSPDFDGVESGQSPPRDPDRRSDTSRAPPL